MQGIVGELQGIEDYKKLLRQVCRANAISFTALRGLTTTKIKKYYYRTLKHYESNPDKAKCSWFENQLRLFHWLLIIQSFLLKQPIVSFQDQHWQKIQTVFALKPLNMLEFQARRLMGSSARGYRCWSAQECELLKKIMEDGSTENRWNEVSRRFYEQSRKKFYRCSKQCREQWLNHLDHSKKHGQWTSDEDIKILQFVLKNGHKWARICRDLLPSRTEHMVKNRFKSIIIKNPQFQTSNGNYNERKNIRKIIWNLKKGISLIDEAQRLKISPHDAIQYAQVGLGGAKDFHSQTMNNTETLNNGCGLRQIENNVAFQHAHQFIQRQPLNACTSISTMCYQDAFASAAWMNPDVCYSSGFCLYFPYYSPFQSVTLHHTDSLC